MVGYFYEESCPLEEEASRRSQLWNLRPWARHHSPPRLSCKHLHMWCKGFESCSGSHRSGQGISGSGSLQAPKGSTEATTTCHDLFHEGLHWASKMASPQKPEVTEAPKMPEVTTGWRVDPLKRQPEVIDLTGEDWLTSPSGVGISSDQVHDAAQSYSVSGT